MNLALLSLGIIACILSAIKPMHWKSIPLNMATVPVIVVATLLSFGIINQESLKLGLFGNELLEPWKILAIFFGAAYAANSTDVSGIFDTIAHKIVRIARGDSRRLFLFFYLFSAALTVFTSNDIVILTLTPIIFYLGAHARLNVIPFLFAEFLGANTLSMLLIIGNPTNIIVAEAFNLSFLEYINVMWLPTLVATVTTYGLIRWWFRKELSKPYTYDSTSQSHLKNIIDASISSLLMLGMLFTLFISEYIGVEIWQVIAIFTCLFLLDDLFISQYYAPKHRALNGKQQVYRQLYGITKETSDFHLTRKRMPWRIAPFILALFILVQSLLSSGGLDWLVLFMIDQSQTLFSGIFTTGITSFFMANVLNNQPMTILMSNVLASGQSQISETILLANAYALVIASNLGANLTLLGALAGLMWRNILDVKGVKISYWQFLRVGIVIAPIVLLITLSVLCGQFLLAHTVLV